MSQNKVEREKDGQLVPRPAFEGVPPGDHPVLRISSADVFRAKYRVTVRTRDRIDGGQPKDPKTMEKWLETRGFTPDEIDALIRNRREESERAKQKNGVEPVIVGPDKILMTAPVPDQGVDTRPDDYVEEEVQRTWSGFLQDENGLYIEGRQPKAMMREAATELGLTKTKYAFRQRLQHGFFLAPNKLYLMKPREDGSFAFLQEPDGFRTKVVHAWTPKGKIAAFSRHDYVNSPIIQFEILVVNEDVVTEDDIKRMLLLGEELGLGANRSQGEGKIDVVGFEVVWRNPNPTPVHKGKKPKKEEEES